jgi:flagellar basal body-associated protein FliL
MFGLLGITGQIKLLIIAVAVAGTLGAAKTYSLMSHQAERHQAKHDRQVLATAVLDREAEIQAHKDANAQREADLQAQKSSTAYDQAALDMIEAKNRELRDALAKAEADQTEPVAGFRFPDQWLRKRPKSAPVANQVGGSVPGTVPAR